MGGKRKNTVDRETPLPQGRPGHKSVAAPSPVLVDVPVRAVSSAKVLAAGAIPVTVAEAEGELVKLLDSDVPKTVLRCDECHGPLKSPVYQCSSMRHVVCGECGGGGDDDDDDDDDGYECSSCTDLAASAFYVHSSYLDTLFGYTKVACPYKKYGCASSFALRDAADHTSACVFAPFACPECSFEGSPADLVRHLTGESGRHRLTAHKITYGKDHRYVFYVANSGKDFQKLLVAEEDDGVFILDIDNRKDFHFFNLVCVRNKAGAGAAYSSSVAVEGPPAKGLTVKVERKVVPSCQALAELEYDNYEALPVHPVLLHWEQTKKLHLCIRISKTQSISA